MTDFFNKTLYPGYRELRRREEMRGEWRKWLDSLEGDPEIHPEILKKMNQVLEHVIKPTGLVPGGMPSNEEGPNASYLLCWDSGEMHVELELYPEGWEWFWTQRHGREMGGNENRPAHLDLDWFRGRLVGWMGSEEAP